MLRLSDLACALNEFAALVVAEQATEGRGDQRQDQAEECAPRTALNSILRLLRMHLLNRLLGLLLRPLGLLRRLLRVRLRLVRCHVGDVADVAPECPNEPGNAGTGQPQQRGTESTEQHAVEGRGRAGVTLFVWTIR